MNTHLSKRCAFCMLMKPMSKEDVFAKWMRNVIPQQGAGSHVGEQQAPLFETTAASFPSTIATENKGTQGLLRFAMSAKAATTDG